MENEFHIKKPDDLTKVNSNDINELLWWSCHFGTNPEKLLSIVHKGSSLVETVREHLKTEYLRSHN